MEEDALSQLCSFLHRRDSIDVSQLDKDSYLIPQPQQPVVDETHYQSTKDHLEKDPFDIVKAFKKLRATFKLSDRMDATNHPPDQTAHLAQDAVMAPELPGPHLMSLEQFFAAPQTEARDGDEMSSLQQKQPSELPLAGSPQPLLLGDFTSLQTERASAGQEDDSSSSIDKLRELCRSRSLECRSEFFLNPGSKWAVNVQLVQPEHRDVPERIVYQTGHLGPVHPSKLEVESIAAQQAISYLEGVEVSGAIGFKSSTVQFPDHATDDMHGIEMNIDGPAKAAATRASSVMTDISQASNAGSVSRLNEALQRMGLCARFNFEEPNHGAFTASLVIGKLGNRGLPITIVYQSQQADKAYPSKKAAKSAAAEVALEAIAKGMDVGDGNGVQCHDDAQPSPTGIHASAERDEIATHDSLLVDAISRGATPSIDKGSAAGVQNSTPATARLTSLIQQLKLSLTCDVYEVLPMLFTATIRIQKPHDDGPDPEVLYSTFRDSDPYPSKQTARNAASEQAIAFLTSEAGIAVIGREAYRHVDHDAFGGAEQERAVDRDIPNLIQGVNWVGKLNNYAQSKGLRAPDYAAVQLAEGWRCTALLCIAGNETTELDVIKRRGGVYLAQRNAKKSAAMMVMSAVEEQNRDENVAVPTEAVHPNAAGRIHPDLMSLQVQGAANPTPPLAIKAEQNMSGADFVELGQPGSGRRDNSHNEDFAMTDAVNTTPQVTVNRIHPDRMLLQAAEAANPTAVASTGPMWSASGANAVGMVRVARKTQNGKGSGVSAADPIDIDSDNDGPSADSVHNMTTRSRRAANRSAPKLPRAPAAQRASAVMAGKHANGVNAGLRSLTKQQKFGALQYIRFTSSDDTVKVEKVCQLLGIVPPAYHFVNVEHASGMQVTGFAIFNKIPANRPSLAGLVGETKGWKSKKAARPVLRKRVLDLVMDMAEREFSGP